MVNKHKGSFFFRPHLLLFLSFFLLYFAAGSFLAYVLRIYHNDAIARTALGFFTAFGRNPHLAAVGFVWQPLPSLIQVPLLFLLRPLGLQMLAGPFVVSILGAWSIVFVSKITELLQQGKRSASSRLITLLYGLHPMIVLYAAIGSSETIFLWSLLGFSQYLLKWFYSKKQTHLMLASLFLVSGFGSRYESLPAFLAATGIIFLVLLYRKEKRERIEGIALQFSVPFLYAVGMWIEVNWAIMGNPFYFLNSIYSNAGFTDTLHQSTAGMEYSYHSVINTLLYVAKRVLLLAPGLALLPFVLVQKIHRKWPQFQESLILFITLLAPYFAILCFHVYQLFSGESFGWLRFFIYAVVAVTLWALYAVKKQPYLRFPLILLLIFGFVTSTYAMTLPAYGKEENSFMGKLIDPSIELDYTRTYADQQAVAAFMDTQTGKILIDTDEGFAVPLFANDPTRYVITSDIDYKLIVGDYTQYVQWVIVPMPNADNIHKNVILLNNPHIWDGTVSNLTLYKKIDGWGIFKVGQPLPLLK